MSNKKKPKKLRTPNVSAKAMTAAAAAPSAPAQARGGGQELAATPRISRAAPAPQANFDYTYVKKDLTRIGTLAAGFIAVLVVLSFFIK